MVIFNNSNLFQLLNQHPHRFRNMQTPTSVLYKDHTVEIGNTYIKIFKYYFPLATSKTVMFTDIQKISIEDAAGAGQNWGMCTKYLNNWFPLDRKRKNKSKFIALHLKGKSIKPSFTPQDPQKVFNLIYQNFTEEGKRVVQLRSSQCGKQTQIEQQQIIERMKEEAKEKHQESQKENQQNEGKMEKNQIIGSNILEEVKVLENVENRMRCEDSPSKRKIVKAEVIQEIEND